MSSVIDEEHQTARMHLKYWATCFASRFCGVSVPITVPLKRGGFRRLYDKPMFPGFLWSEWQDLNLGPPRPELGVSPQNSS